MNRKIKCLADTEFLFLQGTEDEGTEPDEYIDAAEQNPVRERIAKKLKKDAGANVNSTGEGETENKSVSRR